MLLELQLGGWGCNSFLLDALGSSRTLVQTVHWILKRTAGQPSNLYCRDPVTSGRVIKLPQTCFSFLYRKHILRLHFVQHLCIAWHNASLYPHPGCCCNPNNDIFFFLLGDRWHQLPTQRQWSPEMVAYSSLPYPKLPCPPPHCSLFLFSHLSSSLCSFLEHRR